MFLGPLKHKTPSTCSERLSAVIWLLHAPLQTKCILNDAGGLEVVLSEGSRELNGKYGVQFEKHESLKVPFKRNHSLKCL